MADGDWFGFGGADMPCDVAEIAAAHPELNVWLGKTAYWDAPENWSKGTVPSSLRGFCYLNGTVKGATFGVAND